MFYLFRMYWVFKNFTFYNKNFIFYNFFYLNNFNFFLVKNNLKFNFFNFNLNPPIKLNVSLKKKLLNNNILINYFKYFNKIILLHNNSIKNNQLQILYSYKKSNFYFFNNYNFYFFKKIFNLLLELNLNNFNYLILDSSYKNIFPLYNYIFNFNNLLVYKNFFFIKSSFFTYTNWSFFWLNFLKKFKISFIFIFDYFYFFKFFQTMKNANLPIGSFLPINIINGFIDYPIYFYNFLSIEKLIVLNMFSKVFFISLNFKNYNNKLKYLNLFYNFSLNLKKI